MEFNKVRIVLLAALLIFACKNKFEKKSSILNTANDKTTIFVANKLGIPIMITSTKTLEKRTSNQIVTLKKHDTIQLNLNKDDLITISHKTMLTDSLILSPGDNLFINITIDSTYNKIVKRNQTKSLLNNERSLKDIKRSWYDKRIDSIAQLFYQVDYSNPVELENDYEKLNIYPFKINYNYLKKNNSELEKLADLKISFLIEWREKHPAYPDSDIRLGILREKTFTDLIDLYNISKDENILNLTSSKIFLNDSTHRYPFGYRYLYNAIYNIHFKNLQNKSPSKVHYYQSQIFDSLSNYLDDKFIKYGRMICLTEMAEQGGSLHETNKYFNKFDTLYKDSVFKKQFENIYLTNLKQLYSSKANESILNNFGEVSNLKDILNQSNGKVVYIDFWASWCAPCRKAMAASLKLRSAYKESNVNFLFLSIDKNSKAWENASIVEGLENYEYNYLLLNKDGSDLMKGLKINTIPRYLLYDKNGKLVHQNAPGPGDSEIRKLLDKYLIQ